MESYEKLKNLPDADKAKYFEVLIESIKLSNDDSDDSKKNNEKRLNLDAILNITNECNVSAEGSSRKKQKTLDSWLIKPKDSSPNKDKKRESSHSSEESADQSLSSNINSVSACFNANQPTLNNFEVSSSKDKQNSSKNTKQSDRVCNSPVKNVCISGIVTENYKLRSKRKNTDSSQLSKSKSRTKSSVFADNIGINKSNRESIQSSSTNISDVNHAVSPADIVSNNTNLVDKNDCQGVSNLNSSLSKITKNRRSRKTNLNLQDLSQPCITLNNVAVNNDLDIGEKAVSSANNATDSSSLSNWEAFHILEAECARINLNIVDILQDENVKTVLNDPKKLDNEAVLFIKAYKPNSGGTLPVVHLVDSIKKLDERLKKFKKSV